MIGWNPKQLSGWLPAALGLFVFISGRVCVYVRSLEKPHVLRNDPAHQSEYKYELLLILPIICLNLGITREHTSPRGPTG